MTEVALILVVAVAALVLWLAFEVNRLKRTVEAVPEDGGIYESLRRLDSDLASVEQIVADLQPRLHGVEAQVPHMIRHTAVVSYDAYGDVAGHLSRSIALLDGRGNGLVVSLLVGREHTRWFTKEVRDGRGVDQLSPEEQEVVRRALAG